MPSVPLGKQLASTDKKTRDRAVNGLALFLSDPDRQPLSQADIRKLWKGIFYCFWMSDKPLVQQALSTELAELLLAIPSTPSSLAFLAGFWQAIVREWSAIDRLRMDKYYMLVRRFLNASFRLLMRAEWDETSIDEYNSILSKKGGPLCYDDNRVPTSIAYHLADIYLEELDKVMAAPTAAVLPVPLLRLLTPFFVLASRSNSTITYERIDSSLIKPLLRVLAPPREDEPPISKRPRLSLDPTFSDLLANACLSDPQNEGKLSSTELRSGVLKRLFDVASSPDTRESSRRRLYSIWKTAKAEDEGLEEQVLNAA